MYPQKRKREEIKPSERARILEALNALENSDKQLIKKFGLQGLRYSMVVSVGFSDGPEFARRINASYHDVCLVFKSVSNHKPQEFRQEFPELRQRRFELRRTISRSVI